MSSFLERLHKYIVKFWASEDDSCQSRAFHVKDGDHHTIGIDSLRVLIIKDGENTWYAQAIDINYAASGTSLESVKENFALGLTATLNAHIRRFGNIDKLMRNAPARDVAPILSQQHKTLEFNSISTCDFKGVNLSREALPYHNISFIQCLTIAS